MGLSSSSDEWCRHSDQALKGLLFTKKIVDDILVWANDLPTLYERIRTIAERCQNLNIVLSKEKFAIGTELPFAGLIVSAKGVKPEPVWIVALSEFPTPKDITGIRSFLGLANQLSGFIPDFAHMTVKLRSCLQRRTPFYGWRITRKT